MRRSINPMYKAACGRTTKPTTLLFGDDIAKTMQEVKAMSRITQNISARPSRRNPYQRFGNSASQNNSFLSQRGWGLPSPQRSGQSPTIQPSREEVLKELENVTHKVSTLDFFIINFLRPYLLFRVKSFSAGQISRYLTSWSKITSDPYILQIVSGDLIEFVQPPEIQRQYPANSISYQHAPLIEQEISDLLSNNVLKRCAHENGQFISPIFCVPKKDGKIRIILNLKQLKSFVAYHHFKMETIQSILAMITPNCWMASIDLKDAYYSVRVHPSCQRYLKFCYEGSLYAYTAYPNGFASCPRQFTKLLKPPVAELRSQGHIIASYIDDIYLQSGTY